MQIAACYSKEKQAVDPQVTAILFKLKTNQQIQL